MPILKPSAPPISSPDPTLEKELRVMRAAGLAVEDDATVEKRAIAAANRYGLGVDDIVAKLATKMDCDNDGAAIAAMRMGLQIHQHPSFIPKSGTESAAPQVTFVINSQNFNMQQILSPQVSRKVIE